MKEFKKKEGQEFVNKLEWEAPKLICLDKGETEGGPGNSYEDFTSAPS